MAVILYVEDDEINGIVMQGLLRKYKLEVEIAKTVAEARDLITSNSYPLILMDIQLGDEEVDGVTLAKEIRQKDVYKECPIFAVTASADPDSESYFLNEGFNYFFSKPIDSHALGKAIQLFLPPEIK